MDTRMIDVAIGLALVFAMTSLLVTAMQEVYSSWRKLRGRVLYEAIVSFLGDDTDFAKTVLAHPLLVSLAPETAGKHNARRPSYLGADTLVSALISTLLHDQPGGLRPDTPLQFVEALKTTAADAAVGSGPNAEFVRGLAALAAGVERDWPAFEARVGAWFDAVAERSTGWFKRKTQAGVFIIGLGVAAAVNINPIVVASRLWTDEPLRTAVVSAAEKASAAYAASAAASGDPKVGARASGTAPAAGMTAQRPASPSPLAAVEDAHAALMAALDRAAVQARTDTATRPRCRRWRWTRCASSANCQPGVPVAARPAMRWWCGSTRLRSACSQRSAPPPIPPTCARRCSASPTPAPRRPAHRRRGLTPPPSPRNLRHRSPTVSRSVAKECPPTRRSTSSACSSTSSAPCSRPACRLAGRPRCPHESSTTAAQRVRRAAGRHCRWSTSRGSETCC